MHCRATICEAAFSNSLMFAGRYSLTQEGKWLRAVSITSAIRWRRKKRFSGPAVSRDKTSMVSRTITVDDNHSHQRQRNCPAESTVRNAETTQNWNGGVH